MLNISVKFFKNVHLQVLKHEKVGSWVKLTEIWDGEIIWNKSTLNQDGLYIQKKTNENRLQFTNPVQQL